MQPGKDINDHPQQVPIDESAAGGLAAFSSNPSSATESEHRKSMDQFTQRPPISPSPAAVLRYIEAIVRQPLMDEKIFDEGVKDAAGAFRKGPFGAGGNPEAFNADVLRALMDQTCGDAGAALDDDSSMRCFPESAESIATREYVRELIAWQKMPKNLVNRTRQGAAHGTAPSCAGRSGPKMSLDSISARDSGSLCDGADGFLDGGTLSPSIDISTLTEKLSSSTLKEVGRHLLDQSEGSSSSSAADSSRTENYDSLLMRRLGEATATAASQLLQYDDKKQRALQQEPSDSRWRGGDGGGRGVANRFHEIKEDRLRGLSKYLDIKCTDVGGVYSSLSGIGALLLFNSLPLATLKQCCRDLAINIADDASMDIHLLPETLAEKISAYLHPIPNDRVSLSRLAFIPRLQVHECAAGSYICTIDNARILGQLPLERYSSNRFSCHKIKWRCLLRAKRGYLHLFLWHRHPTALNVHLMIRTAEVKRKRRNGSGASTKQSPTPEPSPQNSEPLFFETEALAEPNELVGVQNFLSVQDALSSPTTSPHGLRTYNVAEDRIVFMLSLSINVSETPFGEMLNQKEVFDGFPFDTRNQSLSSNEEDKRQQEVRAAAVAAAVETEEQQRGAVVSSWHAGFRQLQYAEYREGLRAKQLTRARERQQMREKAGPSPELLREVEKYRQSLQTAQQQVAKLTRERGAEEKERRRLRERVEEGRAELERLRVAQEEKNAALLKMEEEIRAAQHRTAEKRRRMERRRQRRDQSRWNDLKNDMDSAVTTTNADDALSINDFGLFLNNSAGPSPDPIFHTGGQLSEATHQETFAFSTAQVTSSVDLMGPGAAPVFSTQPNVRSYMGAEDFEVLAPPMRATPSPHHPLSTTPPLSSSPMMGNGGGGVPLAAFGTMSPSPFSTNPVTHTSLYAHMDSAGTPAFHINPSGSGMAELHAPPQSSNPQSCAIPQAPVSAFTVTAGVPTSAAIPFNAFQPESLYAAPAERNTPPAGTPHPFYNDPMSHVDGFSASAW